MSENAGCYPGSSRSYLLEKGSEVVRGYVPGVAEVADVQLHGLAGVEARHHAVLPRKKSFCVIDW